MYQIGLFLLAILAGALPFAVPQACGQALREGLALCAGPLLLSLFPFLVVSSLLVQCPAGDLLAIPLRPAAWCIGVQAPCAARVLLIGLFGGFAPAANAAAQARPHRAAHPAPGGCAPARLRLFRAVVRGPDGRADAAPQHGAWHPAVSGAAERRVSYGCAAEPAFGGGAAGHVHRPAARSPAAAADRPSHACDHGVSEALRLRALLPDAGGGGGRCVPACRGHRVRHAVGSLLRLRPCRPHRAVGAVCSAAPPSVCRGFRSCCRSVRSARPK